MNTSNTNFYTNGTSALKMPAPECSAGKARIIKLRENTAVCPNHVSEASHAHTKQRARISLLLERIVNASEMLSSLRYESMSGCPYAAFTHSNIALLSVGASAIGVLSLMLGA